MSLYTEELCSLSEHKLPEVLVTITFAERSNDQRDDILPLMILSTDEKTTFLQSTYLSSDENGKLSKL